MKKSSFIAMFFGTISGVFFALGMCMALLPEWGAFKPGIIFGCIGLALGAVTVFVWRRMEHKIPVKVSGRAVLITALGIFGALLLGVGMCFSMVWGKLLHGIIIGLISIFMLIALIPLIRGIH